MEWDRVLMYLGAGLLGALSTLGGAIIVAWRKMRDSELDAGAEIRDELRVELQDSREENKKLRNALYELRQERLELKRALDQRDHRIELLEHRVAQLERRQGILEECSDGEEV